jgi:hypothetical protein
VDALCKETDGDGEDGAYDLHFDDAGPDEIADALRDTLKVGFGLTGAEPCELQLFINEIGVNPPAPPDTPTRVIAGRAFYQVKINGEDRWVSLADREGEPCAGIH